MVYLMHHGVTRKPPSHVVASGLDLQIWQRIFTHFQYFSMTNHDRRWYASLMEGSTIWSKYCRGFVSLLEPKNFQSSTRVSEGESMEQVLCLSSCLFSNLQELLFLLGRSHLRSKEVPVDALIYESVVSILGRRTTAHIDRDLGADDTGIGKMKHGRRLDGPELCSYITSVIERFAAYCYPCFPSFRLEEWTAR